MAERVVTIGFAVFCMNCEQPIRPATDMDATGDVHHCSHCNQESEVACGITITADYKEDLQATYEQMKANMHLVHEILMLKFKPRDET